MYMFEILSHSFKKQNILQLKVMEEFRYYKSKVLFHLIRSLHRYNNHKLFKVHFLLELLTI